MSFICTSAALNLSLSMHRSALIRMNVLWFSLHPDDGLVLGELVAIFGLAPCELGTIIEIIRTKTISNCVKLQD